MRSSCKLFTFLLFLISSVSFSQSFSKAKFRQLYTQGNLMVMEGFYDTASKVFLQLHKSDTSNANINYKIGYCYLNMPSEKLKSISYLEKAIRQSKGEYHGDEPTEKNAPENTLLYLGQAYHYAYRFDDAIRCFDKYRTMIGKWNLNLVKEVNHHIETSKNAKELIASPVECTITNMGDSVNSEYADYSPVITADESEILFTSRRLGTGGAENKTMTGNFFEDIMICHRAPYGTWTKAKGISRSINTNGNEATVGLSADGQQLYVYKDDEGGGNIYLCKKDGNYWNSPIKIEGEVNSKKWEPSACISADGNTMYFVSDRKGGYGGRDIYQCHKLSDNTWSTPENLGPTINTPYDEDAPFIHPDGITFFFSSTGHNSIGGFDIFYSTKVANNIWSKPVNMGYPINTTGDDIYFVTSSDGRRGYFSSFRPDGKGEKDIYMVSMQQPFVKSIAILVGYLKNKDGSPIPKNSQVIIQSSKGNKFSNVPNEASGKFLLSLFPGESYDISIKANNSLVFQDTFFLPEDSSYQNLGRGFFQQTIYVGDTMNLFSAKKISVIKQSTKNIPLNGKILLSKDTNDAAKALTIDLLNSVGNIIASTTTDEHGQFAFKNISSEQNYLIKINDNDPQIKTNHQFYLASTGEKTVLPASKENTHFLFKNIASELNNTNTISATDPTLSAMSGTLTGDNGKEKQAIANATLMLSNKHGDTVQQKVTDQHGHFLFEHLSSDTNYTISIKANDPALYNIKKVSLVDNHEKLISVIEKSGDYFIFRNLPTDLTKASKIETTDNFRLVTMNGKVLKSRNAKNGVSNLNIELRSSNGRLIQHTKTDAHGGFKFERLSEDSNYTVQINTHDPQLRTVNKAFLSNEDGRIVKVIDISKKENEFTNLHVSQSGIFTFKNTQLISSHKDSLNILQPGHFKYPGDENYDFVLYFHYNRNDINNSGNYDAMINKIVQNIHNHDRSEVTIAASSSTVPTATFASNELLAVSRANEIKEKIQTSLKQRHIDQTKIFFTITTKVQGPEYNNDALANRVLYEKWQFVKVSVKE